MNNNYIITSTITTSPPPPPTPVGPGIPIDDHLITITLVTLIVFVVYHIFKNKIIKN